MTKRKPREKKKAFKRAQDFASRFESCMKPHHLTLVKTAWLVGPMHMKALERIRELEQKRDDARMKANELGLELTKLKGKSNGAWRDNNVDLVGGYDHGISLDAQSSKQILALRNKLDLCQTRNKELEQKLKVATEALELIAANYHGGKFQSDARKALKKIEGEK